MSRTQWCCLLAVLTVVLGLFCGPATASVTPAAGSHPIVAAGGGEGVPGCGRDTGHDGTEPAGPVRGRAAHDQAPGLATWGLPATTTGAGPAEPPLRIAARGPEPATPGPVELSVLRV
ncbi:hypothetical protein F0344_16305 [Streptomyces finlayi]|uniref:Secreted protein n=1 Tax=Streptomyces finlayi TaxID=67296 RepID=A0A7G7BKX0_9ACTN|nr:hypothetical protein [Streptomyces finlayi]QNE75985.1 hypothetical protein F0344_16305 [Streptomyces finlayi]